MNILKNGMNNVRNVLIARDDRNKGSCMGISIGLGLYFSWNMLQIIYGTSEILPIRSILFFTTILFILSSPIFISIGLGFLTGKCVSKFLIGENIQKCELIQKMIKENNIVNCNEIITNLVIAAENNGYEDEEELSYYEPDIFFQIIQKHLKRP